MRQPLSPAPISKNAGRDPPDLIHASAVASIEATRWHFLELLRFWEKVATEIGTMPHGFVLAVRVAAIQTKWSSAHEWMGRHKWG